MFNNFHVIIFHVKIFSYTSRPYENILTTKIFLQRKFRVQRYTYVEQLMEELRRESCIHGHIYKEIWNPCLGEILQCERDPHNVVDRYSVLCTPRFIVLPMTCSTSLSIACEGRLQDSDPLGSGRPFSG